ncbi:MAG: Ada metal-binding domain-containing protein [Bacteroidota bacterium]
MTEHIALNNSDLWQQIRKKEINFAGNKKLKIFGTLHCKSGKRMKKENRVFFKSGSEAMAKGYRSCGHCMREEYKKWKEHNGPVQ